MLRHHSRAQKEAGLASPTLRKGSRKGQEQDEGVDAGTATGQSMGGSERDGTGVVVPSNALPVVTWRTNEEKGGKQTYDTREVDKWFEQGSGSAPSVVSAFSAYRFRHIHNFHLNKTHPLNFFNATHARRCLRKHADCALRSLITTPNPNAQDATQTPRPPRPSQQTSERIP